MRLNLTKTLSDSSVTALLTLVAAILFQAGHLGAQVPTDPNPPPSGATGSSLPALGGIPTPPDCIFCSDCGVGGTIGNVAGWGGPGAVSEVGLGAHQNVCYLTGPCSDQHPSTCGGQDQEDFAAAVDAVWEALATDDTMGAYRVATSQPEGSRLYYAPTRHAIQARGCNDTVVSLHIPLRGLLTPEERRLVETDHPGFSDK